MNKDEFIIYAAIQYFGAGGDIDTIYEQIDFSDEMIYPSRIKYYCEKGVKSGFIKKIKGGPRGNKRIYSKGDTPFVYHLMQV